MTVPGPAVTVVIPTYNSAPLLQEALESLRAQTFTNWEAIVVDNYSNDDTLERIARMNDPRIRAIQFRNNGIIAASRNVAIREAAAPLVAFLDADDIWLPHKLEDQVPVFATHPDLVMVYGIAELFGNIHPLAAEFGVMPRPSAAALDHQALRRQNVVACSTVVVRTDVLRSIGGLDEDPAIRTICDHDLWLRVSEVGRMGLVARINTLYRIHPGGASRDPEEQAQRVRNLFAKRGWPAQTYAFARQRGVMFRVARAAVLLATTAWLKVRERGGRLVGAAVPVIR